MGLTMKQNLGPLGEVDLLTDSELKRSLGHSFDRLVREWYRGVDYLGFAGQGNGTNTITLAGADQGYTWNFKLVSVQLAASGTLSVYPSETTSVAPIAVATSTANSGNNDAVITWSGNQVVLKDGRTITLLSSQIIVNWRVMVQQVPTEMQGKL
jgi:hypothetical protein